MNKKIIHIYLTNVKSVTVQDCEVTHGKLDHLIVSRDSDAKEVIQK